MPFDLATAKPAGAGGFDLASAKPVEPSAPQGPSTSFHEQAQTGVNEGIADTLGLPVDTIANVMDLVKAGAGTTYGAVTGKPVPDALSVGDRKGVVGSSDWLKGLMQQSHMTTSTPPQTGPQKVGRFGGELVGGALGPAGPARAEKTAATAAKAIESEAPAVRASVKEMGEARKAGYVLPPTQANPSAGNKVIEGLSGKLQTRQEASIRNQDVTNELAAKSLGLKKGAALNDEALEQVRERAGKAYQAVRDVKAPISANAEYKKGVNELGAEWAAVEQRFPDLVNSADIQTLRKALNSVDGASPSQTVDLIRFLRASAKVNFKNGDSPEKLALAQAQREGAQLVEGLLERNLRANVSASLYEDFVKARQTIARSYDVEAALTQSGNVSAVKLAALGRKRSFNGELETIANFGASFPHAGQLPEKVGGTPMSLVDLGIGFMGEAASGNFLGMSAALARPAARKLLLSNWYQDRFVAPRGAP